MGSVILFNAARMQAIEDGTIVSGIVNGFGHLILTRHDGSTVDAGLVLAPNLADASLSVKGILQLASTGEVTAQTDNTKAITPLTLGQRLTAVLPAASSTTIQGLVELATNAETQTGVDAARAVTPASLASLTASSSRSGLVELSTDAEALTGTDTGRAVTPANLASVLGAVNGYTLLSVKTLTAASVTFEGLLGLPYTGYRIEFVSRGTSATVTAYLRLSGANVTTSFYDRTNNLTRNATVAGSTLVSQASWVLSGVTNTLHYHTLDIEGLTQSVATIVLHDGGTHSNPAVLNTANAEFRQFLTHQLNTAYDGIRIDLNGVSQTYNARLYGKI